MSDTLVSPNGEHEVKTDDLEPSEVTHYRAMGYATKEEHKAGEKAQAEHDKYLAERAEAADPVSTVAPSAKTEKAKS